MNLPKLLAATALLAGALWLRLREPPRYPDFVTDPPERLVALAQERLREDPGSPYRWSDLGDSLAALGRTSEASYCFRRAVELGPNIPPVLMRAANFYMRTGQTGAALPHMLRILDLVTEYDAIVFHYWDHLFAFDGVLAALAGHPRAARAYFLHLTASNRIPEAAKAWQSLRAAGLAGLDAATAYVEALLRNGRPAEAVEAWASWLGPLAGDYPRGNLLYNGGFEREFTGSPLDWRIRPLPGVEVVRDPGRATEGRFSLRAAFPGTENMAYSHVAQQTFARAGRYRLSLWISSEGLTTDQGVLVLVSQAGPRGSVLAETEQVRGTTAWRPLAVEFRLAEPALLTVQLRRNPSRKFDSKIRGTVWVDAVRLEPLP